MAKAKKTEAATATGHDAFNNIITLADTTVSSTTGYSKKCKDAAEAKKHFDEVVANANWNEYR